MNSCAYACYNKEKKVRLESSSGGVFSLLAEKIIAKGGVIYAAIYNDNMQVEHHRIDSILGIQKARGAKYVFSRLGNTINDIKNDLQKGLTVMFVGTPCQCAGVLSATKDINENLLVVDFVCHGVPDSTIWQFYLDSCEKNGLNIKSLNMRSKKTGWTNYNYCWEIITDDNRSLFERQQDNIYMRGFSNDLYLRNTCYSCKYKAFERSTDITLGDFWGIWDWKPDMDDNKGTSLVIVHSDKGMEFFQDIKSNLCVCEAPKDCVIKYNPSIINCASKNENYEKFIEYRSAGLTFEQCVNRCLRKSVIQRTKMMAKRVYKKIAK